MTKTLNSCTQEAKDKHELWLGILEDKEALLSRNKTKEEALQLANYFEGRFDAFCDANCLINASEKP